MAAAAAAISLVVKGVSMVTAPRSSKTLNCSALIIVPSLLKQHMAKSKASSRSSRSPFRFGLNYRR